MGCLSSCLCVENCQDYKFQLWWSCDTAPAFSGITIPTHLNPLNCLIAPPTIRANNMWGFFPPQRKINKVHWFRTQHNWKLILRTSRLVLTAALLSFYHAFQTALTSYYWFLPQLWLNRLISLATALYLHWLFKRACRTSEITAEFSSRGLFDLTQGKPYWTGWVCASTQVTVQLSLEQWEFS